MRLLRSARWQYRALVLVGVTVAGAAVIWLVAVALGSPIVPILLAILAVAALGALASQLFQSAPPAVLETHDEPRDPRILIGEFYAAFNARNVDGALAFLHPDVRWSTGWDGAWVHGRAAVAEFWQRQWRSIDPVITPVAVSVDASGTLFAQVHQVMRDRTGGVLAEANVFHVFTERDDLFDRMEIRPLGQPRA